MTELSPFFIPPLAHDPRLACRSRGFSFTEIMFAVIVLGIGFIMIAAIFPVAIQQGKVTSEESTAANTAREALAYLALAGAGGDSDTLYPDSAGGPLFPATGNSNSQTGQVFSLRDSRLNNPTFATPGRPVDELWKLVKAHLIVPSDQRFAFVGLYRRDGDQANRKTWSPYAQVWFIPVTSRVRSNYDPLTDAGSATATANVNLQCQKVQVSIDSPTTITSTKAVSGYALLDWTGPASTLTEGSYVIIADDKIIAPIVGSVKVNAGRMNGRIYHVGARRPDLDDTVNSPPKYIGYDLAPDGDFALDAGFDGQMSSTPTATSDDIYSIGMTSGGTAFNVPVGQSPFGNASGPATAFVLGIDQSGTTGTNTGKAQDISAYTTFIKVN